jgi:hypothetical protein
MAAYGLLHERDDQQAGFARAGWGAKASGTAGAYAHRASRTQNREPRTA